MARIRCRCAPKRRAQTQAYSRQLRIFKRNRLFQQAPFHTFPARDPLLSPWFFSKLRVVDFFDPSLGEANSSVSHTILIFSTKKCDFESRLFPYNSVFVRHPDLTVPYRILLFQRFFEPVRSLIAHVSSHAGCRWVPPREGLRGELRMKTIDHKGPQMPPSRVTAIRDFDSPPLP